MLSPEISYPAEQPVSGYTGAGFYEVDHAAAPVELEFDVPEDGTYAISVVYANGNGPVNTENKCAVRTLTVDGAEAGTLVMPHRGVANWDDWGLSNTINADLTAGKHRLGIVFMPQDENMNLKTNHALIDRVVIKKK